MGRVGRGPSLRALGEAFDQGITFFDTARSYGYGRSESLLGEFLVGKRDKVVISTKFGILPAPQNRFKDAIKPIARQVLKMLPGARSVVQKQIGAQFQRDQFGVDILRASLESSLRELRTDYVDVLFLHSPPASVMNQDELFLELERLVAAGKIRLAGISSNRELVAEIKGTAPPIIQAYQIPAALPMQLSEGVRKSENSSIDRPFVVANSPFGGTQGLVQTRELMLELVEDAEFGFASRFGSLDSGLLADLVLNLIVCDTDIDVVVPAMMRAEHIRSNCAAFSRSRFTAADLDSIWTRLALLARRRLVQA